MKMHDKAILEALENPRIVEWRHFWENLVGPPLMAMESDLVRYGRRRGLSEEVAKLEAEKALEKAIDTLRNQFNQEVVVLPFTADHDNSSETRDLLRGWMEAMLGGTNNNPGMIANARRKAKRRRASDGGELFMSWEDLPTGTMTRGHVENPENRFSDPNGFDGEQFLSTKQGVATAQNALKALPPRDALIYRLWSGFHSQAELAEKEIYDLSQGLNAQERKIIKAVAKGINFKEGQRKLRQRDLVNLFLLSPGTIGKVISRVRQNLLEEFEKAGFRVDQAQDRKAGNYNKAASL